MTGCNHKINNRKKEIERMNNKRIRDALYHANMKQWQLAKLLNIREETLTRKLRDELPLDEQKRIVNLIKEASKK